MGAILKPYERRLHKRTEEAIGARLGEVRLDALRASGRALALEEALEAV